MSDKSKPNPGAELPFAWPNMSEALSLQTKAWMEEQAEILSETQEMISAWTRRRQEAMEAAIRAAQTISTSKDFGAIAQAYSEWFAGSMQRVQADLAAARDEALRFAEIGKKSMTALSTGASGDKAVSRGSSAEPNSTQPAAGPAGTAKRAAAE